MPLIIQAISLDATDLGGHPANLFTAVCGLNPWIPYENIQMNLFKPPSKIIPIFICVIYASQTLSSCAGSGEILITTSNLTTDVSQEFSLKKISSEQDLNKVPEGLRKLVMATNEYDYYYAISPTKGSGGYAFEIQKSKNDYKVCLRAPKPMSAVTTALTTPIALITVHKGVKLSPLILECN